MAEKPKIEEKEKDAETAVVKFLNELAVALSAKEGKIVTFRMKNGSTFTWMDAATSEQYRKKVLDRASKKKP